MSAKLRRRSESTSRRVRRPVEESVPHSLSMRGLAAIVAVSAVFVLCGTWLLSVQFEARDYEMAARKQQEQLFAASDSMKDLEAESGRLNRDEFLREAAMGPLGMVDPLPVSVSEMPVDALRRHELAAAAVRARRDLATERNEIESFSKEAR